MCVCVCVFFLQIDFHYDSVDKVQLFVYACIMHAHMDMIKDSYLRLYKTCVEPL